MVAIAIVDDEPDIGRVIKKALEKEGFSAEAFSDPKKALASIEPGKYAMLITDVRMPSMNGFELYRAVKKIHDKIKVAFITAYEIYRGEFRKVFPSLDIGFFLRKPLRMADVVNCVKKETTG